eukprot:gene3276-13573_t
MVGRRQAECAGAWFGDPEQSALVQLDLFEAGGIYRSDGSGGYEGLRGMTRGEMARDFPTYDIPDRASSDTPDFP